MFASACVAPPGAAPPPSPTEQARLHASGAQSNAPTVTPGTWSKVAATAPAGMSMALLMNDGTVLLQGLESSNWYKLTPDASGSYANGTYSTLAAMPGGYSPLYYASGVLSDGRIVVQGGEYDMGAQAETARGAIYDPIANTWATLTAPTGWAGVGDAPSMILPDGRMMIGKYDTAQQAILDPATLTYTATGTGKADQNSEESWALLWDGTVLTTDIFAGSTSTNSEIYNPATGSWATGGSTQVVLHDAGFETGPIAMRPDGTLIAFGATGHTSVYSQMTKTWTKGPDFPAGLDVADGPAASLPNGNVLVAASPGDYMSPLHLFEFDGTNLTEVPAIDNASSLTSYQIILLPLPNGQILCTSFSTDVELYTPSTAPTDAFEPVIDSIPQLFDGTAPRMAAPPPRGDAPLPLATLHHGRTYEVWARRMNGISQGGYYGDDANPATNYPIGRITNVASGHVFYTRTHDPSTRAIGPTVEGSTLFDIPASIELGSSTLELVANGTASPAVAVEID